MEYCRETSLNNRIALCDERAGSTARLTNENGRQAGCAHSEMVEPQQQWWFAQQSSLACNDAPDDSACGGFDCAIA